RVAARKDLASRTFAPTANRTAAPTKARDRPDAAPRLMKAMARVRDRRAAARKDLASRTFAPTANRIAAPTRARARQDAATHRMIRVTTKARVRRAAARRPKPPVFRMDKEVGRSEPAVPEPGLGLGLRGKH